MIKIVKKNIRRLICNRCGEHKTPEIISERITYLENELKILKQIK